MGSGSGSFLKIVLKNFDVIAAYASVRAIETKSAADDQQWLTYWVLYSMITLFELTFAIVLERLPFWSYAKRMATFWLVLPYFNGAAFVYEQYVRPYFVNHQTVNIWYVGRKKDNITKPDDVLRAAEKYIAENGPGAFERLIGKNEKASKSCCRGSSSRTILERVERESKASFDSNFFSSRTRAFEDEELWELK